MSPNVGRALRILQELARARVRLACIRLTLPSSIWLDMSELEFEQRVESLEREAQRLQRGMSPGECSELTIARAMFLHLLLESAPYRLQGWSDQDPLHRMPPSRLFEWIAYDYERLELAQLESAMTPEEARRYVNASSTTLASDPDAG